MNVKVRYIENIQTQANVVISYNSDSKLMLFELALSCQYQQYEIISDTKAISPSCAN
jgi:hypothetical protein